MIECWRHFSGRASSAPPVSPHCEAFNQYRQNVSLSGLLAERWTCLAHSGEGCVLGQPWPATPAPPSKHSSTMRYLLALASGSMGQEVQEPALYVYAKRWLGLI